MKPTLVPFVILLASVAASPLTTPTIKSAPATDVDFLPVRSSWKPMVPSPEGTKVVVETLNSAPPKKHRALDELEEACLDKCLTLTPGAYPAKQTTESLACKLRCGANTYRGNREAREKAEKRSQADRHLTADTPPGKAKPFPLAKHRAPTVADYKNICFMNCPFIRHPTIPILDPFALLCRVDCLRHAERREREDKEKAERGLQARGEE